MSTRSLVSAAALAMGFFAASCAQRSRSTAPPPDQLAVGDVPGAVPVPGAIAVQGDGRVVPTPKPMTSEATTIAPMPAPGDDSVAAARRRMMNVPKFGDYVYVSELPEAVDRPRPEYPASLRGTGVSGTVMVQALVLADGSVADTRIVKSIPPLDEAAAACVRKWKFKPARNEQGPTAVWVGVPVNFQAQ